MDMLPPMYTGAISAMKYFHVNKISFITCSSTMEPHHTIAISVRNIFQRNRVLSSTFENILERTLSSARYVAKALRHELVSSTTPASLTQEKTWASSSLSVLLVHGHLQQKKTSAFTCASMLVNGVTVAHSVRSLLFLSRA